MGTESVKATSTAPASIRLPLLPRSTWGLRLLYLVLAGQAFSIGLKKQILLDPSIGDLLSWLLYLAATAGVTLGTLWAARQLLVKFGYRKETAQPHGVTSAIFARTITAVAVLLWLVHAGYGIRIQQGFASQQNEQRSAASAGPSDTN